MNTQKYKAGNCGLLREADRSMYENKDTVSRSLIDFERTQYNYNLSQNNYSAKEIKDRIEKITGRTMRKDGVLFGSTILTLPQDYVGDPKRFFQICYNELRMYYQLNEEDIVSAYVHMDETTPHMHFYFIPHSYGNPAKGEKETVSWDKVISRGIYRQQHKYLQEILKEVYNIDVEILNGATKKGTNFEKLSREEKEKGLRIAQQDKEIAEKDQKLAEKDQAISYRDNIIASQDKAIASQETVNADLKEEESELKSNIISLEKIEQAKEANIIHLEERQRKLENQPTNIYEFCEQKVIPLAENILNIRDCKDFKYQLRQFPDYIDAKEEIKPSKGKDEEEYDYE